MQPQGRLRLATKRGQVEAGSRAVAVATALGVHALLLVLFALSFTSWPTLSERPVLNLELTPPLTLTPPAQPRRRRKALQATANPERAQPSGPSAPSELEAHQAPQPPANDLSGGARQALRDLMGCQHAGLLGLSSEERQRCEDRMTAIRKASAPLQLNLDPRGFYAGDTNSEPYLVRKPKNGCKVRVAGDVGPGPMHTQGAVVGFGCGKTF